MLNGYYLDYIALKNKHPMVIHGMLKNSMNLIIPLYSEY